MTTTIPPATDAQLHDPSYTECIPDDYERDTAGDLAPPEDDWPEENTSDELPNYRGEPFGLICFPEGGAMLGDTGAKKEDPMTTQPVQTLPSEIEYRYTADGLEDVESDRYAELVVEELRTVYGRSVRVIAAVEVDGTGDKRPWYPGGSDDNEEVIRDCAREAWERACSEPHVGDRVESHGTGDDEAGFLRAIEGDTATVAWDSNQTTTCDLAELTLIPPTHSY
jgi:hypothetical protein